MSMHERRTLYRSRSTNICGYCKYHRLAITPAQMAQHECLAKQCDHLERHPHPVWEQRAEMKKKRAGRKARLEQKYLEATHAVQP